MDLKRLFKTSPEAATIDPLENSRVIRGDCNAAISIGDDSNSRVRSMRNDYLGWPNQSFVLPEPGALGFVKLGNAVPAAPLHLQEHFQLLAYTTYCTAGQRATTVANRTRPPETNNDTSFVRSLR